MADDVEMEDVWEGEQMRLRHCPGLVHPKHERSSKKAPRPSRVRKGINKTRSSRKSVKRADIFQRAIKDLRDAVLKVEETMPSKDDTPDEDAFANMTVWHTVRAIVGEEEGLAEFNLEQAIDAQDTFLEAATSYIPCGWEHLPGVVSRLEEKIFS